MKITNAIRNSIFNATKNDRLKARKRECFLRRVERVEKGLIYEVVPHGGFGLARAGRHVLVTNLDGPDDCFVQILIDGHIDYIVPYILELV